MGETFITIEQTCSPDGTICSLLVPSHVLGDIIFTLAILVFLNSLITFGLLFNTFIKKIAYD